MSEVYMYVVNIFEDEYLEESEEIVDLLTVGFNVVYTVTFEDHYVVCLRRRLWAKLLYKYILRRG